MSPPPSVVISRLLNDLGYSYENILIRQKCFAIVFSKRGLPQILKCGSKREGTSLPFENDLDEMGVLSSTECFETEEGLRNSRISIKFMLARKRNTAPGYALLKLITPLEHVSDELIYKCLVDLDGGYFLSSDDLKQQFKEFITEASSLPGNKGLFTTCRDTQGPSSPSVFLGGLIRSDNVMAISCCCPSLVYSWRSRHRPFNWPSRELINDVSSLDAHVVPVGYKGSPMQFLEWRICFTFGEIRLIESLNEYQLKLIILLKLISKNEFKPICQDMSTYIIKNLVLWLAESIPSVEFQECNLIKLLMISLKLLKHCIIKRNFPSYMIESRNLFADRITDTEAVQLCQIIDTCLHEGPRMLLRCPKIRDGLALFRTHPATFIHIAECRQRLLTLHNQILELGTEKLKKIFLSDDNLRVETILDVVNRDPSSQETVMLLEEILLQDRESLLSKGLDIDQIFYRRLQYLLS